jgi:hypothetical protein
LDLSMSLSLSLGLGLGVWGLAVWVRVRPWANRWPSSAASRGEVAQQQQSGGQVSRAADAGHEFMSPRPCLQMRSIWMEAAALPCPPMPTHAASPLLSCDPSPYSIKCPTWDLGAAPPGPPASKSSVWLAGEKFQKSTSRSPATPAANHQVDGRVESCLGHGRPEAAQRMNNRSILEAGRSDAHHTMYFH